MNSGSGKKIKTVLFYISLAFIVGIIGFHYYQIVFAEQSGSSPESGSNSRLTTMAATVAGLNYGSTAAGTWGDFGTAFNRIYSAAQGTFNDAKANGTKNGTGGVPGAHDCSTTFGLDCYTKALGGVDDYNAGTSSPPYPADTYHKTWTACNGGNSYCGTSDTTYAEKQDPNTGLVWSSEISTSSNWFTANNCKYPNGLLGDDGVCNTNGEVACYCVKLTGGSKTGCEALGDGNWRLPYQKELMQAYIDGSWGNLSNAANSYWSSTTNSSSTYNAWYVTQLYGYTNNSNKTSTYYVRCVRP
jgi:hypothetical protein